MFHSYLPLISCDVFAATSMIWYIILYDGTSSYQYVQFHWYQYYADKRWSNIQIWIQSTSICGRYYCNMRILQISSCFSTLWSKVEQCCKTYLATYSVHTNPLFQIYISLHRPYDMLHVLQLVSCLLSDSCVMTLN